MRIAVCDDEKEQIAYLRKITEKWVQEHGISAVISEFDSAEAFLFDWTPNKFDILLLDVQMHEKDGVTLAQEIREADRRLIIVFITGYDDYMCMGYEVSALHYLMKPVAEEKLRDVLGRAGNLLVEAPRMIGFNTVAGVIRLKADDILYAEMFSHYAEVYTLAQAVRVKTTMGDLQHLLGDGFFRCHRSYIVGMAHVERITRVGMLLDNGKTVPLSRKLYDAAYKAFMEYNFKGDVT
ncbi:MAG: LytTR family DNA-binding domain-containing protein [Firmicutes bacterium]|nr:LytTR family DNA-binding domain-containing protein [Bacillota bacterium]